MRTKLPIEVVPDEEVLTGDRPLIYVGGKGPVIVEGSERRPCARCGQGAWFSPASLSVITASSRPIKLSCFDCWMNDASN